MKATKKRFKEKVEDPELNLMTKELLALGDNECREE